MRLQAHYCGGLRACSAIRASCHLPTGARPGSRVTGSRALSCQCPTAASVAILYMATADVIANPLISTSLRAPDISVSSTLPGKLTLPPRRPRRRASLGRRRAARWSPVMVSHSWQVPSDLASLLMVTRSCVPSARQLASHKGLPGIRYFGVNESHTEYNCASKCGGRQWLTPTTGRAT